MGDVEGKTKTRQRDGDSYIDYPNECMLLFGVSEWNNILLKCSIFTNKILIGCSDIVEYN